MATSFTINLVSCTSSQGQNDSNPQVISNKWNSKKEYTSDINPKCAYCYNHKLAPVSFKCGMFRFGSPIIYPCNLQHWPPNSATWGAEVEPFAKKFYPPPGWIVRCLIPPFKLVVFHFFWGGVLYWRYMGLLFDYDPYPFTDNGFIGSQEPLFYKLTFKVIELQLRIQLYTDPDEHLEISWRMPLPQHSSACKIWLGKQSTGRSEKNTRDVFDTLNEFLRSNITH